MESQQKSHDLFTKDTLREIEERWINRMAGDEMPAITLEGISELAETLKQSEQSPVADKNI
ncbi:hypothetical protein ACFLS1_09670 [Verrucomicrobiota bacterium]